MFNKLTLFAVLFAITTLLFGCSDDKNPITPPSNNDVLEFSINATSSAKYTYFNLETGDTVSLTDAASRTDANWHLAFRRFYGRANGGISGPGGVKAVNLAKIGHQDSTNFDAIVEIPTVTDAQWSEDKTGFAINGWYSYNPMTHSMTVTRRVFMVRTADSKWAKFVVDSLKNAGSPPNMGTIGIKYFYQADGSNVLDGAPQYVEVDGSSGTVYFSFATGAAVVVTDPMTSMEWDICFNMYDIKVNGGISGSGNAAGLPFDGTAFDALLNVPPGAPVFADAYWSIFGSPTEAGTEWYNYSESHELMSKGHVYLFKLPNNTVYKLQIRNYYKSIEGAPVSGWITVAYQKL